MKTLMYALAFSAMATITHAETTPSGTTQPALQTEQDQTAKSASASSTKRLPGRDCKLHEGGTRQHRYPQYEIGNPDRPACQPAD